MKRMIYVGENKALLCKGDFHPAELYKGDTKIAGYTLTEFSGENGVTLTDCYNDKIYDVQINGKNLLDVNKWYSDWANENGGMTIQSGQLYNISDYFIKVIGIFKGNTRYTFSCKYNLTEATTFLQPRIKYTDGTQSYVRMGISGYGVGEGTITITSVGGKTVEYFGFTYGTNVGTRFECELTEMQIEEGAAATEYEPPCREATVTANCMDDPTKTQTILFENGLLAADIPTFKGTTVIELESDIAATISGKYKKIES